MKILVTGANGFVGSHVAERLASQGAELRLLLRRTSRLHYLDGVDYERAEGDVRHPESLQPAVQGVDTVVHVAGLVAALTESVYQEVNALGTAALVRAARDAGVRRFVYVSSLAALGPSDDGTMPEAPRPISPYGRSKLAGEYAVLSEKDAMSVAIVRPPVVYGQRDRGLLPLYRIAKLGVIPVYGDGSQRLTWIHAHDAADAVITAALAEGPSGAVYSLSDGHTYTWRELVAAYARAAGARVRAINTPTALYAAAAYAGGLLQAAVRKPMPLSPEELLHMRVTAWICDHEAITRDLGWQPKVGIEDGFAQTYRWYREQGLL